MYSSQRENRSAVSDIIARVGAKNKFFDFRNALVPAYTNNYAMLHGIGGENFAPVSGIRLTITDYSKGKGENSVTVYHNVAPYVIDELLSVCRQNAGISVLESQDLSGVVVGLEARMDVLLGTIHSLVRGLMGACGDILNGKGNPKGPLADVGRALSATDKFLATPREGRNVWISGNGRKDYAYHSEKVNTYRRDSRDGFVFVSVLDISRRSFNEKGEELKYPWTVKMKNLYAQPNENGNGTVSYVSKTARDVSEAFVMVSDEDMYRCSYTVDHFIRVWEASCTETLVAEGLTEREKQRRSAEK